MKRRAVVMIAIVAVGSACSTDQPKVPAAIDAGAAPVASAADAGSAVDAVRIVDAGPAVAVDAGAPTAANTASALGTGDRAPPTETAPSATPAKSTVFDRLLAKPKARDFDPQEIKALIEQRTGLKVELARRTAGRWVMIQLVAVPGGRNERDQQRAIAALKELGIFEIVEGDRLMKVKTP